MKKRLLLICILGSLFLVQNLLAPEVGATVRVMPLGDSITMGSNSGVIPINNLYYISYRKALWDRLISSGLDVDFVGSLNSGSEVFGAPEAADHEGHPGWTADQLLNGWPDQPEDGKLIEWLLNNQPDIVLLHIGTNDIGANINDSSPDDVNTILDVIDSYSNDVWVILARIINRNCITNTPPCTESFTTTTYNNNIETIAQTRINYFGDKIVIVDMENGAGINYHLNPVGDMFDGLHPFATGYSKMSGIWFNALEPILPQVAGTNVTLDHIEIIGPNSINENSGGDYNCKAFYTNGTSRLVNPDSWGVSSQYAAISNSGHLTTQEVSSDESVIINASYTEGGITQDVDYSVVIYDGVVQVTLGANYSVDVKNDGTKYYHDGNDWVGRGSSGVLRTATLWDISSIDPAWNVVMVEVRFFAEGRTGVPGSISVDRYGASHGEDDPRSDSGALVYSKSAGSGYASFSEPSSGSWTGWVNLGAAAASDLAWCRDNGKSIWSVGLKASAAVEAGTTANHLDLSEDNEVTNAEIRISYRQTSPSNSPPTAVLDSISPSPVNAGQAVTFTGHGVDTDGTVTAYEWTSSINGTLSSSSTFSTSSLAVGIHTISFRVQDNGGAWSSPVTSSLTVIAPSNSPPTAVLDSISPSPVNAGQAVTFTGHGVDTDGTVTAYEWTSSINGTLSSSSTFSTSSLAVGIHTISFRVQDNGGAWSSPVTSSLTVTGTQVTLGANYSVDVKNDGTKYYHDGNDWVGRGNTGVLRTSTLWDISSIDPAWDVVMVEVRFFVEGKTGVPGSISVDRYGSSHGEDDPRSDSGPLVYSKSAGSGYASFSEPASGSWTNWVNLGATAASDLTWCRDNGKSIWSVGLKASAAVEAGTTVRHVDFSEDNVATNAEIRITYTQTSPSNSPPTAVLDSISPSPVNAGQAVTFTGHGVDTDGTVTAYEWTSSINGTLSSNSTFSTSSLAVGIHTISFRVQDNGGAWSSPVTSSLTVTGTQVTLRANYSVDVKNDGTKYYHDGNDWVGRGNTGVLRTSTLWDISSIDPAWDVVMVEVRFFVEGKTGSTGDISVDRYGSSHGEDDPRSDSGPLVYSKSAGSGYASFSEPASGSWTNWVNLGATAASDLTWCRDNGKSIWSVGLKASAAVEAGTTVRHVDFSEDNVATNAEIRITYR